jgi:hypothetical protein
MPLTIPNVHRHHDRRVTPGALFAVAGLPIFYVAMGATTRCPYIDIPVEDRYAPISKNWSRDGSPADLGQSAGRGRGQFTSSTTCVRAAPRPFANRIDIG